jgi:hypothetical protein
VDRPTKEQVELALSFADAEDRTFPIVHSTMSCLATELRALQAEIAQVRDTLQSSNHRTCNCAERIAAILRGV